jgi:hypothetical protein
LSLSAQALKLLVTLCKTQPNAAVAVAEAALPAALALVTSPLLQVAATGSCLSTSPSTLHAWRSSGNDGLLGLVNAVA